MIYRKHDERSRITDFDDEDTLKKKMSKVMRRMSTQQEPTLGYKAVQAGTYLCDMALWTEWLSRGTCSTANSCSVCSLSAQVLQDVTRDLRLDQAQKVRTYGVRIVRWLNKSNTNGEELDDLSSVSEAVCPKVIMHKEFSLNAAAHKNSV
mmetsp:Transcript_93231/g.161372  ORF Transcript_93231/g.161372 Transcript_93231/m.161372 type:complete len:150 (-) Transcript_93231:62-511(-)